MKYGFVTFYTDKVAEFASEAGFDALEVFADVGSTLDLNVITTDDIKQITDKLDGLNLKISTLTCAPIHLEADASKRSENNAYFIKALKTVKRFGTNIVVTNAFGDKTKSPYDNLKAYKQVFTEFAKVAEGEGVKIAIENCPHWNGLHPMPVGNIAFSPEMWEAIFNEIPSEAIGLEFDPSHLYWMGIDCIKALKDFGSRVYAFHAKDTEILKDKLNKYGIMGMQIGKENEWDAGWWRYRIPGFGEINWKGLYNALYELEYNGPMIIEHEDPVFGGDRSENGLDFGDRTKMGLKLGLAYLKECDILSKV